MVRDDKKMMMCSRCMEGKGEVGSVKVEYVCLYVVVIESRLSFER